MERTPLLGIKRVDNKEKMLPKSVIALSCFFLPHIKSQSSLLMFPSLISNAFQTYCPLHIRKGEVLISQNGNCGEGIIAQTNTSN